MNNYLLVLKLLLKNMFFKKKGGDIESKGRKQAFIILLCVCYVFIAAFIVMMVALLGSLIAQNGSSDEFIAVLFALSSLVIFILGIISMLSTLYFSKDTEFFLSLPIKTSVIFLAKFTIVYITELILAAALLVPALITFGIVAKAGILFYPVVLIGIILAPALPLMLAAILAIPLMYIVGFFKNKGAISSIVLIIIFGAFFAVYIYFVFQMNSGSAMENPELLAENMAASLRNISNVFYPFLALSRLANLTETFALSKGISALINFLIFFGSTAILIVIAILISNTVYRRGAATQLEGAKSKANKKASYAGSTALKSLLLKEWREVIRTPAFAFQCLSGVILAPIMIFIFSSGLFSETLAIEGIDMSILSNISWFVSYMFLLMFGVGLNVTASSSLTREGKNFYFSKILPVSYKTQLQAKQILCFIISFVTIIVGLTVMSIKSFDILNLIFGLAYSAIFAYGLNSFAILHDLKKPKLDWATPNEAVKQNFALMVPYFINIGISIAMLIVSIICFAIIPNAIAAKIVVWVVLYVFAIIFTIIFHKKLFEKPEYYYERLSI